MKRLFIVFIAAAAMLAAAAGVHAEEIITKTVECPLPETYAAEEDTVSLAAVSSSFEDRVLSAWEKVSSTQINVRDLQLTADEVESAYFKAVYNNPRLFYVKTEFTYSKNSSTGLVITVIPHYKTTDTAEISSTLAAIDEETENILWLLNENMSDFDKAMTVHDYMALNYKYDTQTDNELKNYDTSIMTTKTGVCQAYALAFKLVMDKLGLECTYVSSVAMNHAWNLVKLDNERYHVDVTSDDPLMKGSTASNDRYGLVGHKYSFLSSSRIEEIGHNGFDLNGLAADSTLYDDYEWHDSLSSVVYCCYDSYYVSGDGDLVSMSGEKIYKNLDNARDGYWFFASAMASPGGVYAGLAEYNGRLYFNTNKDIRAYNPNDGSVEIIQPAGSTYYCGMYIDGNILMYAQYDSTSKAFVRGGRVLLEDVRIGEPFCYNGKSTIKVFIESGAKLRIYAQDSAGVTINDITQEGRSVVELEHADKHPVLYFWNNSMRPYAPKKEY